MKGYSKYKPFFFQKNDFYSFEERLFISSIFFGILLGIYATLGYLIFTETKVSSLISFSLTVLLSAIYYFANIKKIRLSIITPLVVLGIFTIAATSIFNSGMYGNNLMTNFVVFVLGLILVPEKTKKYIAVLFILSNLTIYLIHLLWPNIIVSYPTKIDFWIDSVLTFTMSSVFLYLIIRFFHNNYTLEKNKAIENEERFKSLFENSSMGLFRMNPDGILQMANPALIKKLGFFSLEDMQSKNVKTEIIHDVHFIDQIEKHGEVIHIETIWIGTEDTTHYMRESVKAIRDIEGKIMYYDGTAEDITEQKLAKIKLDESERTFSEMFLKSPVPTILTIPMEGIILDVNEAFIKESEYSREELIGSSLVDLKLFNDLKDREQILSILKEKGCLYDYEVKFQTKSKKDHIGLISINFIPIHGKLTQLSTVIDITERKKAEEALKENEKKYHDLYTLMRLMSDTMPDMLWAKDLNKKYIFANKAICEKLLNAINTQEPIGKTDLYFAKRERELHPDEPNWHTFGEICADSDTIVLQNMKEMQFDEYGNIKNKFVYLDVHKSPLYNVEGKLIGVVGSARDVTIQKQTEAEMIKAKEKAEESDRLKTAFLQNMSHEIRTPMNAIIGFSGLLSSNFNNKAKLEKFSSIINQRCQDLLGIINDILDISKIESGQLKVNIENCNINDLFIELSTFFSEYKKRIDKKQIEFRIQTSKNDSGLIISTDILKLKQILFNLLSNALKFTNVGFVECGYKIDNNQVVFHISDSGIGISKEKFNLIFERFTQIDHGSSKNIGGTGLGLSIVKGLVHLLGGKIWLESEVGVGTTFFFSLPFNQPQMLSNNLPHNTNEVREYIFPNKTVLIVEDDIYNSEYIKEILTDLNVTILFAVNGKEAVEIALQNNIDLILMDINLPDFDGYEASRQIFESKPNLKIIVQTAYASKEEKQKAIDQGCCDYISKPIDYQLLLSKLNQYLSVSRN